MKRLDDWSDRERRLVLNETGERAWPKAHSPKPRARSAFGRMRFVGQGHELDVPVSAKDSRATLDSAFCLLHSRRYGFTLDIPVEVVSVRHVAEGTGRDARLQREGKPPKQRLNGPASITLSDATLFVAKGWRARLLDIGAWLLELE